MPKTIKVHERQLQGAEEWLVSRAKQNYESLKKRKREMYAYARTRGFNSAEAAILSGWSRERIDAIAKQRQEP